MDEYVIQGKTLTDLADITRELIGIAADIGPDEMITNLRDVQNYVSDAFTAIGNKGGTVPESKVSANLATAIASIPFGGGTVQSVTGTFTTDSQGIATVDCGFRPDYVTVWFRFETTADLTHTDTVYGVLSPYHVDDAALCSMDVSATDNGFQILAEHVGYDWSYAPATNATHDYYAVSYK